MTRESNGGTTVYTVSIELLDVEQAVALRKHAGVLARPQQDPHSLDTPTGLPGDLDHRARTSSTSTATLSKLFEGWASTVPPASSTPLNPQAVEFDPSHQTRRPSHKHRFSTTIKPPFEPFRRLDWRFGRLQVDMRRSASPGNMAHSVDVGFGTIRLRRKTATEQPAASGDGCTLAVLALPPIMTIADFLQFVAPAEDMIRQISILRDEDASRSMALMRFRSAPEAELFQEEFNAKPFWAMSPDEVCHVVYVASIEVRKTASVPFTFPTSTSILEEPAASSSTTQELPSCVVCLERLDSNITGLITIPCQHTFHCACLSRWASGRCPVCRYTQSIAKTEKSKRPMDEEEHQHTACDQCGGTDQLWMCLLCGHVGGGRYACRHAVSHFEQSGHLYAMETETQRVWDYAGDAYVHRLIQNQTDGKLVELPSLGSGNSDGSVDGKGREGPDSAAAEAQAKTEKMAQEFSNLLISQLESQRNYFLEKMSELKQELLMYSDNEEQWRLECEVQEKRLDKARSDLDILLAEKEDAQKALEQMEKATIAELRRDRERLEKKLDKSQEATRASQKDLAVERGISRSSTERMKECQQKLIEKEAACEEHMKEMARLEEYNRDLQANLHWASQLQSSPELFGSTIVVPGRPPHRHVHHHRRASGSSPAYQQQQSLPENSSAAAASATGSKPNKKKKKKAKKPPQAASSSSPPEAEAETELPSELDQIV